jgi:hypothetical protein
MREGRVRRGYYDVQINLLLSIPSFPMISSEAPSF